MAINTYFINIADAIREKGGAGTITPAAMPQAILDLPSGGGIPILSRSEWNSLSTAEKQAYELVGVRDTTTGFQQGVLYYGANYDPFWESITGITIAGYNRNNAGYTQLADMRFSDGTAYLDSQYNNVATYSSTYGNFISGGSQNPQSLFDNNTDTKTISSGNQFEWIFTFSNAVDMSNYNRLELWTANDDSGRDPNTNVVITFYSGNTSKILTLPTPLGMTTTRKALGYYSNTFKNS